ncbi:hypothetical protein [Mesorhizobium sp. A556]
MIACKPTSTREQLATEIKRQLGDRKVARYMQSMPTFKVASDIPHYLRELLDRLEDSEAEAPQGR